MSSDEPALIGDEITVRGATYQRDSQGRWCWVMVDVDSRTTEWGLVNIGEHHMLDEIERLEDKLELQEGEIRLWKRKVERMQEQRTAEWDWHLPPVSPMPAKYDMGDVSTDKGT